MTGHERGDDSGPDLLDAAAIQDALRGGRLTSTELTLRTLDRIERLDPELKAFLLVDRDGALAQAAQADQQRKDGVDGPLLGLPVTVKDTLETAGLRTTAGDERLRHHVPERDAEAVRRWRAAGAVILGKTSTPAMAQDIQTYNKFVGTTNNPWDTGRSPGGSSGGGAAAVASGLSALDLGSDLAGSVRIPAAWCGIYGHRPTWGLVPSLGHVPPPPGAQHEADLVAVGPLARTPALLEAGLLAVAGPCGTQAKAYQLHLPPPRATDLSAFQVGVFIDADAALLAPSVGATLDHLVSQLTDAGADVRPVTLPASMDEIVGLFLRLMYGVVSPVARSFETIADLAGRLPVDLPAVRAARMVSSRVGRYMAALERRAQLRTAFAAFFTDIDVLLMPAVGVPPIRHDHHAHLLVRTLTVDGCRRSHADLLAWSAPAAVVGLPATVVPAIDEEQGLPVGMQVVGDAFEDRTTLAFAAAYEQMMGPAPRPPGIDG